MARNKDLYYIAHKYLGVMREMEDRISDRDKPMDWERLHMSGTARIGYILAEKRGENPVMAACACMLHDYGRVVTGRHKGHAEAGYEPVKEFLRDLDVFTNSEIEKIALCVKDHSNKAEIGDPLVEIVKDADLLDFHQYGFQCEREEQQKRLDKLLKKGEISTK